MTHHGATSWNDLGQALAGTPEITTHSVTDAYEVVLNNAGSLPHDTVDLNSISNTENGTGTWITATDPNLLDDDLFTPVATLIDTDTDGMPDDWEDANGSDKDIPDHNSDKDGNGYRKIEEYFHYRAALLLNGGIDITSPPTNLTIIE